MDHGTRYIEVDGNGEALGSVTVLPETNLRFDHMSDPIVRDGRMVVYGSSHDFELVRYTISPLVMPRSATRFLSKFRSFMYLHVIKNSGNLFGQKEIFCIVTLATLATLQFCHAFS